MKNPEQQIADIISTQPEQEVPAGIKALSDAARDRHGNSVRAVLFYGSSLRTGNVHEGLADLYLLVDNYRSAFKGFALAFFNRVLPPNVFYLEIPFQGQVLRAKYAVLSIADFCRGTRSWFHSYLWGRFSQQCGLVYVQDELFSQQIRQAQADAVMTFIERALPQMKSAFTARDLWAKGLSLSYRAELRPELPEGSARLFDFNPDYYQQLTSAALNTTSFIVPVDADAVPPRYQVKISSKARLLSNLGWRVRTVQGKILSVLRLLKGFITFKGGIEYILWKIERHSGVRVEASDSLKRFPPLAVVVVFWRLYRQGAFR